MRDARIPPHSSAAEESVIGAVLIDNAALDIAAALISADDFHVQAHRMIWVAMCELNERLEPIDLVTLSDALKNKGWLETVGGAAQLAEIVERVPTAASVRYYAKIVQRKALLRSLITLSREVALTAYEERLDDVPQVIGQILALPLEHREEEKSLSETVVDVMKEIGERGRDRQVGISTGLSSLDAMVGGWMPGHYTVIGGRTSNGKSSLVLHSLLSAASCGIKCGLISCEMPKHEVVWRALSQLSGVSLSRIVKNWLWDSEYAPLAIASERLVGLPLEIIGRERRWLAVQTLIRRMANSGARLIAIDHIGYLHIPGSRDPRHLQVSEISKGLKELALRLNVTLLVCAQINREATREKDKRPAIAHLRESGSIEEDADEILLTFLGRMYDANYPKDVIEVIIGKQRNGPTAAVQLRWKAETADVEDIQVEMDFDGRGFSS